MNARGFTAAPGEAAVDGDRRAGDIRGAVGGEEADDVADLARRAEPPGGIAARSDSLGPSG